MQLFLFLIGQIKFFSVKNFGKYKDDSLETEIRENCEIIFIAYLIEYTTTNGNFFISIFIFTKQKVFLIP